jgi:hypothetical protein
MVTSSNNLPIPDLTLQEKDPELYAMIRNEK